MNSFRAGCAKRSSHNEGFTPVSHRSNAISLASCQAGVSKCTSFPSSSKQNRKNRCGYQCRQKRQSLEAAVSPCHFACLPTLASKRHSVRISAATNAWMPNNLTGCARFSANTAISALDVAKYPRATHSNAPHDSQAAAASRVNNEAIPFFSASKLAALPSTSAARAFTSPNIASPKILPVHLPFFSSKRVAHTRIFAVIPRSASWASMARAASRANGSSVPLTSTISWPCFACHATFSTACEKKAGTGNRGLHLGGADACPSAWWPPLCQEETCLSLSPHSSRTCTPRRYILFACKIALIPCVKSRIPSLNHRK